MVIGFLTRANMQSTTGQDEFPDLKSHVAMWGGFTSLLLRGIIGVIVVVLFVGWITGVL
jgi:hypothetical protein